MNKVIIVLVLLSAGGAVVAWQLGVFGGGDEVAVDDNVHTVKRGPLKITLTERGTLKAKKSTKIKCEVHGKLAWLAEEGATILGYAVARASHGVGYVADVLALPGRLDVVSSLLGQALTSETLGAVRRVECWSPVHHPYRRVLSELGFVEKKRTVRLRVVPRGERADPVVFRDDPRASIHVLAGDTDLV